MESLALLVAVQLMAGLCSIFFQAAWAPYLPGLVGRTNLPSANSKILGSASVAQVAGPSLAGTLIGVIGAPLTFVIDALSYLRSALFIARIGMSSHRHDLVNTTGPSCARFDRGFAS
jgi:predicted MFS family arabinose efflux permease